MKKLLRNSLVVLAMLATTLSASAVTVDELLKANNPDNPDMCYAMDVMNIPRHISSSGLYNFTYGYASSGEVKISRSSNFSNCIIVEGLIRGNIKMSFRISGNTVYNVDSNNNFKLPYRQYTLNTKPVSGGTADWPGKVFQLDEVKYSNGAYYFDYANSWTGTISTYDDHYEITMKPFQFSLSNSTSMSNPSIKNFDGLLILIPRYNYNTVVTDRLKGVDRKYPASVEFDVNNKTFYMENFASSGLAIHTSEVYDGIMESTLTGIDGYLVPTSATEGEIHLPDQQVQADVVYTYVPQYYQYANVHERVRIYPDGGSLGDDVVGKYKINYVTHRDEDRWHKKDGGNLVTLRQTSISFDDYRMRSEDGEVELEPWYNTKMEVTDTVTANPTFSSVKLVTSEGFFAVRAYINEKNAQYVDHYELVIVPGIHKSINSSNEFYHEDQGHNRGYNITTLGYDNVYNTNQYQAPAQASTNHGTYINKMFHIDDLTNYGWSKNDIETAKNGAATLYIKTVYTADSGLTPSFHNLTSPDAVTGVEDIVTANDAVVTAQPGMIVIKDSDAIAEVYTTAGTQVYAGADREIAVAPGVYIVRVGNATTKVIVR